MDDLTKNYKCTYNTGKVTRDISRTQWPEWSGSCYGEALQWLTDIISGRHDGLSPSPWALHSYVSVCNNTQKLVSNNFESMKQLLNKQEQLIAARTSNRPRLTWSVGSRMQIERTYLNLFADKNSGNRFGFMYVLLHPKRTVSHIVAFARTENGPFIYDNAIGCMQMRPGAQHHMLAKDYFLDQWPGWEYERNGKGLCVLSDGLNSDRMTHIGKGELLFSELSNNSSQPIAAARIPRVRLIRR